MAAFSFSTSNVSKILKYLQDNRIFHLDMRKYPTLGILSKKKATGGGNGTIYPIRYSKGGGRSHTFATAQTGTTPGSYQNFLVGTIQDFAVGQIDMHLAAASESNKQAFVSAIGDTLRAKIEKLRENMAFELFGDGSGVRSDATTTVSTATITLSSTLSMAQYFAKFLHVGDVIEGRDASAAQHAPTDGTISAVDLALGTVTVTNNGGSAISNGDEIYISGDFVALASRINAGATNVGSPATGFDGWLPSGVATTMHPGTDTAWYGVTRTSDKQLSGAYYDGSGVGLVQEALIDADRYLVDQFGGEPKLVITSPYQFAKLEKELGSNVRYGKMVAKSLEGAIADIGFKTIQLHSQSGAVVDVLPDRACKPASFYMLDTDDWEMPSLGETPSLQSYGGENMLAVYNANSTEFRVKSYYNLACKAPGFQLRGLLAL
jgi:hypothetical protein